MGSLNGLLNRCHVEKGYIEKASGNNLDSKEGNKGTNNYTKYARDINALGLMGCQGQPWCATYQFYQDVKEFGLEKALELWHMTRSTYVGYNCFSTRNRFKKAGKTSKTPKLGALVIFTFSHMGRVISIDWNKRRFRTNEGNTSAKTYDRNGGMVAEKEYSFNDPKIDCFCIIDYEENIEDEDTSDKGGYSYMFELPSLVKGAKGAAVELLQVLLIGYGYSVGESGADGDFGRNTETAVKEFQKNRGIKINYPGTVGNKTWKELIGV